MVDYGGSLCMAIMIVLWNGYTHFICREKVKGLINYFIKILFTLGEKADDLNLKGNKLKDEISLIKK